MSTYLKFEIESQTVTIVSWALNLLNTILSTKK